MSEKFVDGNAAAGALGEVFAAEMTTARGECARCGRQAMLGEALVFSAGPGIVVRCARCHEVLLRLVRDDGRAWLDVRGLAFLQFARPA